MIGYFQYGVEMPWDGSNSLPSMVCRDCLVEVEFKLGGTKEVGLAGRFNWMMVKSYKVVDERCKPKPEDSSRFDRGDLPPVGEECEVYIEQRNYWAKVKVLAVDGDYIVWRNGSDNKSYIGTHKDNVRPIRTDREKAVETASKIMHEAAQGKINDLSLGALYDAGLLRLPEEK